MIYVFGDYELNTAHYELRHKGVALRIEPKAFDLLAYLVQNHDQVITKEALHEHLWPDQFVSDSALTYYIATARKAVGDSGRSQHLIKTVYSRGYAFVAPVEERSSTPRSTDPATDPATEPASASAEPEPASAHSTSFGERRQLTVMWGGIVVSSMHGRPLDPEEQHDLTLQAQAVYRSIIEQYSGYLAQNLSHGFIAYFGYPQAHEEDARRAVQAGLDIIHAIDNLQPQDHHSGEITFTARIGIHTGIAVMGAVGSGPQREQLALGETPHMTSELATIAPPNTVVISPSTLRLVEGYFIHRGLGGYYLEKLDQSLAVYQVLQPSGRQSRLEAAEQQRLTPFVGREQEVGLLRERWEQAKTGIGQVVLLGGEAGIGKSRLVQTLYDHIEPEAPARIACRCSPSTQHSAFYPITEYLQQAAQLDRTDAPEIRLQKVETILQHLNLDPVEAIPLLAPLLALPTTEAYPPIDLPPQRHHQKTLEILLAWLLQELTMQPACVMMVEDLHWADPSTIDFLTLLIDQVAATSVTLIVTFRSEFQAPWTARSHVGYITLNRLTPLQVEDMILRVTGQKSLPATLHQQLVEKTDGIPLFIEEMTRMVLESGLVKEEQSHYELIDTISPLAVPSTLHDSLMARLDRLGGGKQTAQLAATVGRDFSYEVIQAVSPLDETVLRHELDQLVNAELLYQRGLIPQSQYVFKHALIQEAAYQSLLRSTRKGYHQQIAQVLEERFPEMRRLQPELLAYHYAGAELNTQAIAAWQQASKHAINRGAYVEAVTHLEQALALLATLPSTTARYEDELSTQLALGVALTATKGYAAPEVEHAYRRARELCRQVEDSPHLFTVLRGLWLVNLVRGQLHMAIDVGEQLLQLAEQSSDVAFQMEAHRAAGTGLFFQGQLAESQVHFEQALSLYETPLHTASFVQHGQDTGVVCLAYIALILWLQGYPAQATGRIESALALAQQHKNPWSHAMALQFMGMLNHGYRNVEAVHESTEACLSLAHEYTFPFFVAIAQTFQGWVLSKQGQGQAGIAKIRQGLAGYQATGSRLARPYMLALLAEIYLDNSEFEESLTILDEAKAIGSRNSEWWWEAELHRLTGECFLARANSGPGAGDSATSAQQAEQAFQQALATAERQQAKALQLRAALSLGRLWQQLGRHDEARQVITSIYESFTEGHRTAELTEAQTLLASLR